MLAQILQQPWAEQAVAILLPLALLHPDRHALTVKISDFKCTDLRDAQPRSVRGHQQHSVLELRSRGEQPLDLLAAQDLPATSAASVTAVR